MGNAVIIWDNLVPLSAILVEVYLAMGGSLAIDYPSDSDTSEDTAAMDSGAVAAISKKQRRRTDRDITVSCLMMMYQKWFDATGSSNIGQLLERLKRVCDWNSSPTSCVAEVANLRSLFLLAVQLAPNTLIPRKLNRLAIMSMHRPDRPIMFGTGKDLETFSEEQSSVIRAAMSKLKAMAAEQIVFDRAMVGVSPDVHRDIMSIMEKDRRVDDESYEQNE